MSPAFRLPACVAAGLVLAQSGRTVEAADWPRFRGPNGSGVSGDEAAVPAEWDESTKTNIKWKVPLPGPGHSSPIVIGDKVLLTCWTGYATEEGDLGDQQKLRYHLVCIDRRDGSTRWTTEIEPELPEEEFRGNFTQHGYTTHTPASDGERVFAFFGKSGVAAFDLEGKRLWRTSVGTNLDSRQWGSASSPILRGDLVIVLAGIEDGALVALDKATGRQVWKQEAEGFDGIWGTPVLAESETDGTDVVVVVNGEIWGMNPETGKLRWFCEGPAGRSMAISAVSEGGVVYALGGREGGTTAVRTGGKGDVTASHRLWTSSRRGGMGTPILHDGRLHWVDGGIAYAIDAKTGEELYRERIDGGEAPDEGAESGRGGGFGGRGGGRDYPSPVAAAGRLYQLTGAGEVIVIELGGAFRLLARNRLDGEGTRFVATPAVSDGEMFVRSGKALFCIGAD